LQPKPAHVKTSGQPTQSKFIEDIVIQPNIIATEQNQNSETGNNHSGFFKTKEFANFNSSLEQFSAIHFKYAVLLDVPVESIENLFLYKAINDWWGVPYRMGGTSKRGVDCSAFVQNLLMEVYALQIPRTARTQKSFSYGIPYKELKEGDLVFFNTRGGVSHVGVYLQHNKFVHASTSKGVMISDLNDSYWKPKLIGAGRVLPIGIPAP
jgi:lipoprotein Spr